MTLSRRTLLCAVAIFTTLWCAVPVLAQNTTSSDPIEGAQTEEQAPTPTDAVTPYTASGGQLRDSGINRPQQEGSYESARLISTKLDTESTEQTGTQRQLYEIEIRSGTLKGKHLTITSDVTSNPYQLQPRVGDKIVVFIQQDDQGNPVVYLEGFDRRGTMILLVLFFILTLVLLSGWQGLKIATSIGVSIFMIGWILIPAFLRGANPIPIAIFLAATFTCISSGLTFGWNRKTLVTTIGTVGGTIVAYIISSIFAHSAHVSGLGSEEDRLFFSQNPTLDPRGLLFAGIIIAAMGVVEDVAVSIASGIEQVAKANPSSSLKDLFTAGMVVGKDHMAAMANTLIFAYVGASLSTLLLYSQYDANWLKFLNFDTVTEEVIRSLAATIGLVFTVPITAICAAWFALPRERQRQRSLIHRKEG
jgi:uncharacterized membrane protein